MSDKSKPEVQIDSEGRKFIVSHISDHSFSDVFEKFIAKWQPDHEALVLGENRRRLSSHFSNKPNDVLG